MRIAMVGCMVMNREINYIVARSPNIVRAWWMRQGLHETPQVLRAKLQETIDAIEAENRSLPEQLRFEAIALGYGLCSNSTVGLHSRTLPIVVPRCDDCISLFLGSADRYRALFEEMAGVFWYSRSWIEQSAMPSKANYDLQRARYAEEFGEENADYLMSCTNDWMSNYRYCGYITCPLGGDEPYRAYARQAAADFGWTYREIEGRLSYFEALLNGPWDGERFLVCPPGHQIRPDYSNRKLRSEPC